MGFREDLSLLRGIDDNDPYKQQKSGEISQNFEKYTIKGGDNLSKIAKTFGFANYFDLLEYNLLLGNDLRDKIKKLRPGDKIFIPKDINKITQDLKGIREVLKQKNINTNVEKVRAGDDIALLKEELNEKIYPKKPVSLGLPKYIGGFGAYQERTFDPLNARTVLRTNAKDRKMNMEISANCSHFMRMLFSQGLNLNDLPENFRKFLTKGNIDAWNFPIEIKKLGSFQKMNLMEYFQASRVGKGSYPVPEKDIKKYDDSIIDLGDYLRKDGKIGSLIPMYYLYSRYLDNSDGNPNNVRQANYGRTEKHYNSHMVAFVGNRTMNFEASEINSQKTDIINTMINFLQSRSDSKYLSQNAHRGTYLRGIKKYHKLIDINIRRIENGEEKIIPINIEEELKKPENKQFKVNKDDKIEISGPMIVDGMHMDNRKEEDLKNKMNATTRFLFERVAGGDFLPTELIEHDPAGPFSKEKFGDYRDKLDVLGVYDLRDGEIIEKKIKKVILQIYKYKFEALDKKDPKYENKYKRLLNYIYAKQIKGLQITGYLQDENNLNPGATDINRGIPFFNMDTVDEAFDKINSGLPFSSIDIIDKAFEEYIDSVKEKRTEKNDKLGKLKTYVDVQIFPGENYSQLFSRIVDYLKQNFGSEDYKNLKKIENLNFFLKRKFVEDFVNESLRLKTKVKSDEKKGYDYLKIDGKKIPVPKRKPEFADITNGKEVLEGKAKVGVKFILELDRIDKILDNLSKVSHLEDFKPKTRKVDEEVIEIVSSTEMDRNNLRKVMITESYVFKNDSSFIPNGSRIILKELSENHEWFREYIQKISSYGDFQIRIQELKKGYSKEWPTREQLLKAVNMLRNPEIKNIIERIKKSGNSDLSQINSDLERVEKIRRILNKEDPENFEALTNALIEILKIDDEGNSHIVGKIIGASIANDKMHNHIKNIIGILQASGENIEEIYKDEKKMKIVQEMAILAYNKGERPVLLGMNTNFLLRIIKESKLEEKTGIKLNMPVVDVLSTMDKVVSKINKKLPDNINLGFTEIDIRLDENKKREYDLDVYQDHLEKNILDFLLQINRKNGLSEEDNKLIEMLRVFCSNILHIKGKKEYVIKNTFLEIYKFQSNSDLKKALGENKINGETVTINSNILPTEKELELNDSFRGGLFNHIRKVYTQELVR